MVLMYIFFFLAWMMSCIIEHTMASFRQLKRLRPHHLVFVCLLQAVWIVGVLLYVGHGVSKFGTVFTPSKTAGKVVDHTNDPNIYNFLNVKRSREFDLLLAKDAGPCSVLANIVHRVELDDDELPAHLRGRWKGADFDYFGPRHGNLDPLASLIREAPVKEAHDFPRLHTPRAPGCSRTKTDLLICVASNPANFEARQAIRQTWGRWPVRQNTSLHGERSRFVDLVFFIGNPHNKMTQQRIDKENKIHGDLFQSDFHDCSANRTLKTISIIKYASQACPQALFVLKVDDDVFMNIPLLIAALERAQADWKISTHFIMGSEVFSGVPFRDPMCKWFIPWSYYKLNKYPPHMLSFAYAMPHSSADRLFQASLRTPTFPLEDVYIGGFCRIKSGVKILHTQQFVKSPVESLRDKSVISRHGLTSEEILAAHKDLGYIVVT